VEFARKLYFNVKRFKGEISSQGSTFCTNRQREVQTNTLWHTDHSPIIGG
jgi:hypothetical protein